MHSNLCTRDGVTSARGCITFGHLVCRAEQGIVLYGLLVLVTVVETPLLGVFGVVGGVIIFLAVQSLLHVWGQRLESHRGQSGCSICLVSFPPRTLFAPCLFERSAFAFAGQGIPSLSSLSRHGPK